MKFLCKKFPAKQVLTAVMMMASMSGFAAKELSDRELRATADSNTAVLTTSIILQCPKNMEPVACERLKTLRYAREGQTQRSYDQFLNQQTENPISNQVIKQPLMTQPMQPK